MRKSETIGLALTIITLGVTALGVILSVRADLAAENAKTWLEFLPVLILALVKALIYPASVAVLTCVVFSWRLRAKDRLTLEAFAFLDPPDRERAFVQWQVKHGLSNASLMLDIKPRGQPVMRKELLVGFNATPGQTMKTLLCQKQGNGWIWATTEGQMMHDVDMACRLVLVSEHKIVGIWRFAIPSRHHSEAPKIADEALFTAFA